MIYEAGISKFLFRSDYPMWDHVEELCRFKKLELKREDEEQILSLNAQKLLKSIKSVTV
jgi:predicted TIM-barrel fold metal-dependent hydrolase